MQKSFWLDRPVFVTGGSGLVGSWLVKRLVEAGAEVVCLIRDWYRNPSWCDRHVRARQGRQG